MSFAAITVGLGVVAAGTTIYSSIKQANAAKKIKPDYEPYTPSEYPKEQLAIAKQLFNGRMPAAQAMEQNILASQGNFLGAVNRNATDSSQALSLAGLSQGATNQAFENLGIDEAKSKYDYLNNLNAAYSAMTKEGDKEYESMFEKYQSDVNAKMALRGAAAQNLQTGLNSLAGSAFIANQAYGGSKAMGAGNSGLGSYGSYWGGWGGHN